MFHSARLKLTAWYLFIIMLISMFFSMAFYNGATREIYRFIHRIEHDQEESFVFRPPPPVSIQELQDSEQRLLVTLVVINLSILFIAGGSGYFLAGRTLRPIKDMVDEQNRFITDSSHELRTPLTALRSEMEASLLENSLTVKGAKKLIKSNLEEVVNLQVLSDNLLQLAQYQKQNTKPEFKEVSLLQVIEDALKKVTAVAKGKNISNHNTIDDATLKGNAHDLCELFVILLDNAIKYSAEKTTVTLTSEKQDHSIVIEVTDEGIGIDPKDISHIFDRFYRANKSRSKSAAAGYGLGLSIAKNIVQEHKGTIAVESKVGKGTTFTLQLPVNS